MNSPLATRFELRAPCPKCNTYLVLAVAYITMLDGISAAIKAEKTAAQLEKAISKKKGSPAFYLEKERAYRSEKDVFEEYTQEERDELFGAPPHTVWDNISAFRKYPDKFNILKKDGILTDLLLSSYEAATIIQWSTELKNRILPETMELVRSCKKLHEESTATDLDLKNWREIDDLRNYIGVDALENKGLLTRIIQKLADGAYEEASALEIELQRDAKLLEETYTTYSKNMI
jgi:glutamine synthetase